MKRRKGAQGLHLADASVVINDESISRETRLRFSEEVVTPLHARNLQPEVKESYATLGSVISLTEIMERECVAA